MAKVVIIGNSAAGFSACQALAASAVSPEITVVSNESYPAYNRNALTDFFLGNIKEKELFLCQEGFYRDKGITFAAGAGVSRLDTKKQRLVLKNNDKVTYDYLIIASGSRPALPDVPGKGKDGVLSFYCLEDIRRIKERLMISQVACVIAGRPLCAKLAQAIASKGKEVKVISRQPFDCAQDQSIELIAGVQVKEFIGEGELQAVKLDNGKIIGASLAVFAGDNAPATDFLRETEIATSAGYVVVDDAMRTNLENVFACGSVCVRQAQGPCDKGWDQACAEGTLVAQNILTLIEKGRATCQSC
ncbi:MAG TPA: FAD-dependent oxidoreductase [Patescibacteria group bacterium]|nr:FAD-dependent oxidoreductase [Patescibacteria group bacterium]